jgi:excisionase family DNA binding protein
MKDQRALSVRQFASSVGIGRSRAFEEIRLGRLRALKCGTRTIIPAEAVNEWLAALPIRGGGAPK